MKAQNRCDIAFRGILVFHFFSLFIDVFSVKIVFYVNYVNHSPLYPYNIIQSTLDVSNTVISKSY